MPEPLTRRERETNIARSPRRKLLAEISIDGAEDLGSLAHRDPATRPYDNTRRARLVQNRMNRAVEMIRDATKTGGAYPLKVVAERVAGESGKSLRTCQDDLKILLRNDKRLQDNLDGTVTWIGGAE